MTSIVIFSPSSVVRAGLETITDGRDDLTVVAAAGTAQELESAISALQPDVVVADVPGTSATVLADVLRLAPASVTLGDNQDGVVLHDALQLGGRALLHRDAGREEILSAVDAAAAGLVVLEPRTAVMLAGATTLSNRREESLTEHLTRREIEVLGMLAEGLGNKIIARRLGISEHTVKFHLASIFGKLDAGSRTEAVTKGLREGLISV